MSEVVNAESLGRKLVSLYRNVLPAAAARAVNRVASTVRTRTGRSIAKATGLKVGTVKRRVVIARKATPQVPAAAIRISGRPVNLIHFKPTPKDPETSQSRRRGVRTSAWGRRQLHREAFIAKMPNGTVLVVKRSAGGRAGKKIKSKSSAWAGKSPHIEAMFGPGIANEAASAALREEREVTVRERLPIELRREIRYKVTRLLAR